MASNGYATSIAEIKRKIDCRALFEQEFPGHWRPNGNSLCPSHEDTQPSLQVERDHLYCHAEGKRYDCFDIIMKSQGVSFSEAVRILAERAGIAVDQTGSSSRKQVVSYDYTDEAGNLLYQVIRYDPKSFKQRRPDGNKGWIWNLKNTRRVLYRLPDVLQDDPIFIVEGECDADRLSALGFCGTTAPHGAGKWNSLVAKYQIREPLRGKTIYIVPDNDSEGAKHARQIARSLCGFAESVKILNLPGLAPKQDISDFIEMHGDDDAESQLLELMESTPEWEPGPDDAAVDDANEGQEEDREGRSAFPLLLDLMEQSKTEVFQDQLGRFWAAVNFGGYSKNLPLNGPGFCCHLRRLFGDRYRRGLGSETIRQVTGYLEGTCNLTRRLYLRVAHLGDKLLIDLCWPTGECIEVTDSGWRITQLQPPIFEQHPSQKPLPEPASERTDLNRVLKYLPQLSREQEILVLVWLVVVFIESVPRPGLIIHGVQGSGKSWLVELLRSLVDPSEPPHISLSKDEFEFIQHMSHNYLVCLDNLSKLPQRFSDCLCRAVTGSGFSKRRLYSDDSDILYRFTRTFMADGISVPGSSPDLLDRSVLIELRAIEEEQRRDLSDLIGSFEQERSMIFAGLLDALSKTFAIKPSIALEHKPRMSDFATWGAAAALALSYSQEEFLAAYAANRGAQHETILENDPVCAPLLAFLGDKPTWQGAPSLLYSELQTIAEETKTDKSKDWPKSPAAMSRRLRELEPILKSYGVSITRSYADGKRRQRVVAFTQDRDVPKTSSDASDASEHNNINTLAPTASPTTFEPAPNRVGNRVGNNSPESLNCDDSDDADDIFGNLSAWACRTCAEFEETDRFRICRYGNDIRDLSDPCSFRCPKQRAETEPEPVEQAQFAL